VEDKNIGTKQYDEVIPPFDVLQFPYKYILLDKFYEYDVNMYKLQFYA